VIVVDTNIIAYLYLPTEFTERVERLLRRDPVWTAPILWRSEFRNVLARYLRSGLIDFSRALRLQTEAESLLRDNEYEVSSIDVLQLAAESARSAYDCEFVALAQALRTKLVTTDKALIAAFPSTALSPDAFLS